MEFKPKRAYAVASIIFIIMVVILGYGFYDSNREKITIPKNQTVEDITNINIEENEVDDNISEEEEEIIEVPTFSNGMKCVDYAIDILLNGKGYKSINTITASGSIAGVTEYQKITETKIRSGNYYYKTTGAKSSSSFGKEFFRYFYSEDGTNMYYRRTSKTNSDLTPDWSGASGEKYDTCENICSDYDIQLFEHLTIIPNKTNSNLIKFDKSSDKDYYIIVLNFDVSKLSDLYIRATLEEGELEDIIPQSIKFTLAIEKKTGYLRKMIKDESYVAVKNGAIKPQIQSYSETVFTVMNKEIIPQKPF